MQKFTSYSNHFFFSASCLQMGCDFHNTCWSPSQGAQVRQGRNQLGPVFPPLCRHNSTTGGFFLPLHVPQHLLCTLFSGCTITFCIPCGLCSLMCFSEAERVFFPARKVVTMAMIKETGISEHVKHHCLAAVCFLWCSLSVSLALYPATGSVMVCVSV